MREILQETFEDCTIYAAQDTLDATDAAFGLKKLTRLFDNLNAERAGVYAERQVTYTLVPALSPHTIGPSGSSPTFTVTQRPVTVEAASLVISDIRYPLRMRDSSWWGSLSQPELSTSIPTDLYYSPDWPLGRLYLWPVPDTAYELELMTRVVLADLGLDDTLTLPPGYRDAVTLTLGEMIVPSYPPAVAPPGGEKARARIFSNNDVTPKLATADAGTSRGSGWSINNFYRGY